MKNVRELETYGAILIGCGIMAYTLMLASVDAPVWVTIEFVMGTLFMVVGVWCVYLAGMARTMARSRVDTCLGRVKRCFSHALIFAA